MDTEAHPPRRKIRTKVARPPEGLSFTGQAALALLGVFVVAMTLAGLLAAFLGLQAGLAGLGLAVGALVASYMLGSD